MKASGEYIIAFRGLSDGSHDYHWEIGKSFFESNPDSEIHDAKISVGLILVKSNRLFELNFKLKGSLTLSCDRCLDDLEIPVDSERQLIVRESHGEQSEDDDIIFITPSDYELNVFQVINDFILLSLPMRKVHNEGMCNAAMMDRLKDIQIEEAEEDL